MWNGTNPQGPNWQGNVSSGGSDVGDLYIVPDPPTILTNPSIGLEERNEVPLPTKYKDFDVANLTASNINGNPNFDASKWSLYKAIHNVEGTLSPLIFPGIPRRLYDIKDFRDVTATNFYATTDGLLGGSVNAVTGNIITLNSTTAYVGVDSGAGLVEINGVNKLALQNALSVTGGVTLDGGGTVHGISIGTQPFGGVNTIRIDVLPVGIDIASATYITMESTVGNWATAAAMSLAAGAALSVAAGGALSLAGGSYIEYNSDQHYFTNTSQGPDFTDIFVGNIHPAEGGSQPLNINGQRGIQMNDVKSINLFSNENRPAWNNLTTYNPDTIVSIGTSFYVCREMNANTNPTVQIPLFVLNDPYVQNEVIYQNTVGAYRAKTTITDATSLPNADEANWEFLFAQQDITRIWDVHTPTASTITGDGASILTIGTINSTNNAVGVEVGGLGLKGKTGNEGLYNFNYLRLQKQVGSDAAVQFYDGVDLKAEIDYGADDKLLIQTDNGLVINNTAGTTDFSKGDVVNITTIALTNDLKPLWSNVNPYTYTQMVFYDGTNYTNIVSNPKINLNNTPGLVDNWVSGAGYEIGNIRYQSSVGNLYYCIAFHSGVTTEPSLDTTNWELFYAGSSSSIIWEPSAVVATGLIGNAESLFTVGGARFVNRNGEYLSIQTGNPTLKDAEITSDGLMTFTAQNGLLMFSETEGVGVLSAEGIVTLLSLNGQVSVQSQTSTALVSGGLGATLESEAGNVAVQTITSGDVNISSIDNVNITAVNDVSISTTGVAKDIDVVATGNLTLQTLANVCDITLQSAQSINLTSVDDTYITTTGAFGANIGLSATGNITLQTTGATADITMTSADNLTISSADNMLVQTTGINSTLNLTGYDNTTLSSLAGNVSVIGDYINVQGSSKATLQATAGDCELGAGTGSSVRAFSNLVFDNGGTGDKITGKSTGLTIENVVGFTPSGSSITFNDSNVIGVSTLNGKFLFNYGFFYKTNTQTLDVANTARRISINTSGLGNGITLDTTTNIGRLTFGNTGIFQVVWSGYLLHGSGGAINSYIWIRKNGTDVPGTGKVENNDSQLNETNLASSSMLSITANDYIEFFWAATGTTVPLRATASSGVYPAIPSFSCTIAIVG